MDKLIESLLNLPKDRKIELVKALLKDLDLDRVGSSYRGNGYQSLLFFSKDNIDDPIFEFVTHLPREKLNF